MSRVKGWTNWFRLWGNKRSAARRPDDFADYGTAFGLDMSLAAQGNHPAVAPKSDAYKADRSHTSRFSAST